MGSNQGGGIDVYTRELCVKEQLGSTVKNGAVVVTIVFLGDSDVVEVLVVIEERCVCLKE